MKGFYTSFKKNALLTIIIIHLTFAGFSASYYVSSSGNDSNSGLSTSLPWKSLAKVNASTFIPGDQILFKRGDVFYGSLVVKNSGSSGNPITVGAYDSGANPIITGFTTVSAWTNLGGNIWESTSTVSSLSSCNMVSINDVNTAMGRYPNYNAANSGYLTFQSHSGKTAITSNSLTGTPNWTGAKVAIRTSSWTLEVLGITSHSGGTLNFNSTVYDIPDGYGFFIQNDIKTLDQQNEWYYNSSTKKLSVYSTSQPINVKVASQTNLLTISGDYITVDGVNFTGANESAIYSQLTTVDHVNIFNCNISFSGKNGITFRCDYLDIENNIILNSNNNGMDLVHSTNLTVKNNVIQNTGVLTGMSSGHWGILMGINAHATSNVLIELNRIINTGYLGIYVYGNNTTVNKNFVDTYATVLDDGSGIYTYTGTQAATTNGIISNNIVINGIGAANGSAIGYPLAEGIYLDDMTKNFEVYGNTCAFNADRGIFLHNSAYINLHDNVSYGNARGQLFIFDQAGAFSGLANNGYNLINGNIFLSLSGTDRAVVEYSYTFNDFVNIGTFNNNYYARPLADNNTIRIKTPTISWVDYTLSGWQSLSGKDANSHKTPQTITSVSDLRFEYNASTTPKTITLSYPMMDMKGVKYTGSIILQPYKSVVLIKDVTSASVSGTPTSVVATAGNASASITFVAPASNGGSAITGYTVTSSPAGGVDTGAGSTSLARTITGLTNGTAYTFTVKAINSVGTSIASVPSNSVTPQASSMATTFTFTGPSSGNINSPANFTVTPNNPFTGSITITPSGTASAGLSAKVLTFSNSSVAQTFTITSTVAGSITLNATNSSNLSNPASLTYTVNAVVPDAPASVITQKYSIYSFEESSGTKVIDSMSSYDGDIINTTSRVTGISGNALSITGNGYVNLGQVYGDVQDGLTLSAWVKPTPSGAYEGVIMHGGPNTDTFALYLNYTSRTIAFKTEGITSGKWTEIANSTIWDGSWHLLTVTYNGSQKIIYLDAVPLITVSATGMMDSGAGYNLLIGAGRDEIPVPLTSQYQGIIDEVRIYNYALNSTQISSLFTSANTPTSNTFIFTGPSSGNVNSTSANFTVTPNNLFTGTITITPSGSGSAGLSAKVLSFSNSSVAQTFTITPVVAGSITLSATNNSTLNNPASLIYTSQAVVPDAPTSVFASAGNASASISFVAPANNGGSAITGYTVTSVPAGGVDANAGSTSLTRTITGLTNGSFYTFTVKATNSAGTSVASLASNSVKPQAPTDNTSPIISSFLVPTTSTSLTVPITSLNGSDNIGVSGYLLTDTPTVPSSNATGWTTIAPTSYSFSSADTNTIYAWVKDAAGNVSSSAMQMVTITLEIGQGELKLGHFIPVWNGENGQNHMNFIVVSAILEDMPLTTDDEIGLFSGNACVGAQILSKEIKSADNSTFLTIQASQNDGSGNGFNNNDSILVRIWDKSTSTEFLAKAVVYRNDMPDWITSGKYSAGATAVIEIVSYLEFTQTIELKKGYNLISANVTAENALACHITQPLVDQGNLVKLQDESGNSLENWGSFGGWINNIGTIKTTEGYKIEVANNCILQITGRVVALPLDISLKNGWNIISFPRNDMVDGMAVVKSLIDQGKLVKVQDETGNSIEDWGIYGGWRNGIGNFIPGKAYKIKVNADAVLTIQENYLKSSVILAKAEATTYYQTKVEGNGTDHMNINIVGLREAGISVGDELAAFDGKICVGTLKITANYMNTGTACLIATSADDNGLKGFKPGNKIQVHLWDQETGNETQVQSEVVRGLLNYEINGSVMVKLKSSSIKVDVIDEALKIDVFPNPSSGRVTVRFSEMPDAGSKIEITDVAGRMISSRLISNTSEEFNFDQQTSGLYLVKTILGSNSTIHKLIIRK